MTVAKLNEQLRDNLLALNSMPCAHVTHNAAQGVVSDTAVALTFNTERKDTDTIHDTGTNPSRLTCKTAGRYRVWANVAFETSGTGFRWLYFLVNNTDVIGGPRIPSVTGAETILNASADVTLAVNDYVECIAYHNLGSALDIVKLDKYSPEFGMQRTSE